jgi:hypothetical protein
VSVSARAGAGSFFYLLKSSQQGALDLPQNAQLIGMGLCSSGSREGGGRGTILCNVLASWKA